MHFSSCNCTYNLESPLHILEGTDSIIIDCMKKYLRSRERDQDRSCGDDIIMKDGCAIERTNESRFVLRPNSKVLGKNKASPCRIPVESLRVPRSVRGSLSRAGSGTRGEQLINSYRQGVVVLPARWRCRQFFYYESGHARRRSRTRACT